MSEEVQIDQAVFDKLIAEGKSERIARAKAKAAYVRAQKKAKGEELGPKSFEEQKAKAAAAGGGGGGGGGGAATAVADAGPAAGGMMSAEERQKRVAEALSRKQGKVADLQTPEAKLLRVGRPAPAEHGEPIIRMSRALSSLSRLMNLCGKDRVT